MKEIFEIPKSTEYIGIEHVFPLMFKKQLVRQLYF